MTCRAGVRTDDGTDLADLVAALQEESGTGSTWLLGGGAVHRSFLAEGLVDEIWTHVMPLLLGDGIPMFPASYPAATLTPRRVAVVRETASCSCATASRHPSATKTCEAITMSSSAYSMPLPTSTPESVRRTFTT